MVSLNQFLNDVILDLGFVLGWGSKFYLYLMYTRQMELILKTLFYHLVCIILFGVIYSQMTAQLKKDKGDIELIDYFYLSTAIQSGTGFSQTVPGTTTTKMIVMLQEFLMISGTLISLHIFFRKDIFKFK
jgi:hypothetical protein